MADALALDKLSRSAHKIHGKKQINRNAVTAIDWNPLHHYHSKQLGHTVPFQSAQAPTNSKHLLPV